MWEFDVGHLLTVGPAGGEEVRGISILGVSPERALVRTGRLPRSIAGVVAS